MATVPRIITPIWNGPIYSISILDSLPISAAQAGKNVHANVDVHVCRLFDSERNNAATELVGIA
jgi:hypothetical protein